MSNVNLPTKLPGVFFLLEWDRDRELFVIHVDDADGSSYRFKDGDPIQSAMLQFRLWGLQEIGYAAIDMAREFGAAKAMLSSGRVVAIFDREKHARVDVFAEQEKQNAAYASL